MESFATRTDYVVWLKNEAQQRRTSLEAQNEHTLRRRGSMGKSRFSGDSDISSEEDEEHQFKLSDLGCRYQAPHHVLKYPTGKAVGIGDK
jgi:hypothetical protein